MKSPEELKYIGDVAYNLTVDKVNAFLKFKGLEEEFAQFKPPTLQQRIRTRWENPWKRR